MALSSAELALRFATLTPESKVAQTQLASLVAKHRPHAVGSPVDLVVATSSTASTSTNSTSSDSPDLASLSKYTILLTFGRRGHGRDAGWVVGKLTPNDRGRSTDTWTDIPICPPRSRCIKEPRLFEIFIHSASGVLMIRNIHDSHSLWYLNADNQGNHVELGKNQRYVLHMATNLLRIGSLHYAFRYSIESTGAYVASRKVYMQSWNGDWDVPRCFAVQPQQDHIRLRHAILHSVIAKGDTCVVRAGVQRRTGNPIACKTIQCSQDDTEAVVNEISIASSIAAHASNGLTPLLFRSCGHGYSLPCSRTEVEDMHLVMPYAPFTFETAPWQEMRFSLKLALFRHVLEGLRNLHAAGIMHRDIHPSNLLVFSLQPAAAAISDFGMAKTASQAAEKSLGPLAYQAPEVPTQETYTNAIDIFSMALSILATFEGCVWSGPLSDRAQYSAMLGHLARLESRIPEGLVTLLRAMLSRDPAHRPSAEDILADAVWEQIAEPRAGSTSDGHSSDKSSSMQRPDGDDMPLSGSNRGDDRDSSLRLLTPEAPPLSTSSSSDTTGTDDLTRRMERSAAPPSSSIANNGAGSTAEVLRWDDMNERMRHSDAPPPSSIAADEVLGRTDLSERMERSDAPSPSSIATDEVLGRNGMSDRMNRSDAPPPSSIATDEVLGRNDMTDRMYRSEAPSPSSAANDGN